MDGLDNDNSVIYVSSSAPTDPHKAPSNKSFRGFRIVGGGVNSPGLLHHDQKWTKFYERKQSTDNDVPQLEAGFPMIMLSETPEIPSVFPTADASKR